MKKEVLEFTPEEGRSIVYEDHEDFKEIRKEVIDTSRWSIIYEVVVQRISDGKFFASTYSVGATESQDEQPYEHDNFAEFEEVERKEKTVIVYE